MRSTSLFGRLTLLAVVVAGPACAAAAGSAPDSVTAAARAQWQRRAAAYDLEARFYRAAGKPAAAFLARRAAALSEAYRRRALTGSDAAT
jgi:hypothetical protein